MRQPVTPPTPQATRHSLTNGARIIDGGPERFPFDGIVYEVHNPQNGGTFDPSCQSASDLSELEAENPDLVEWDPAAITWTEGCDNPTPFGIEQARQRAASEIEAHRSHLIERVLWTNQAGGLDLGASHPNVGLADTPATVLNGGAPLGIVPAMSALVGALATGLAGLRGVIHVPALALPFLDFYASAVSVGGSLLPGSADHVLIGGTGYLTTGPDGSDPGEGFAWFYATSTIELRLGPVEIPGPVFVPADNEVKVIATQPVIVSWDRTAHYAVQVCLGDPGPECEGGS